MVEQVPIPHSVVPGKEPLPAELAVAGLAVNLVDGVLYTKGYNGSIIPLNLVTLAKVVAALEFMPAKTSDTQLPAPATDLASALALANGMRVLLISCGIGS